MNPDGDSESKAEKIKKYERTFLNVRDVLFAIWLRFYIQAHHGFDAIILGSRSYFLWTLRLVFLVLYTIIQIYK